MANAAGRLSEVSTDDCVLGGTQYTDEGFSYSRRGEITDVYQSTPHSGGYYHLGLTYWDNGLLNTIAGISGLPTITYKADPGGRPYMVSASTGQNPVTTSAYNAAGQLTSMTFGSGTTDTDAFSYDQQTGRLTQYQYTLGASQQVMQGSPHWNPNGTLQQLAITRDDFNAADVQTCSYTYDDWARIASVNCGTGRNSWRQSFTYDVFGNIWKSGSSSWLPSYNYDPNKNQYVTSPGGISYDAVGNLTNDTQHSYAWDPNWGNPSVVDGQNLVYDALGRMVENSTAGQEFVYLPGGNTPLAVMSGQTMVKAMVPLMGGATAIYSGSTLWYAHADWLGSGRLVTDSATRTMVSDSAYAPFGEQYAGVGSSFYNFTGIQQLTVPGIDDFLFRRYSPVQSRWLSPDPARLAAVDMTNPQTWNRYAYLSNAPLNHVDALGLYCTPYFNKPCQQGAAGFWWGPGIFQAMLLPVIGLSGNDQSSPFSNTSASWSGTGTGQVTASGQNPSLAGSSSFCELGSCGETSEFIFTKDAYASGSTSVAPDFISLNINVALPVFPWVGGTLTVNVGRNGHLYIGPGVNAGKSLTLVSGSLTGNYLTKPAALQNFLTSNSFNVTGGFQGGAQGGWTPGSGFSYGGGYVSPQIGAAWTYSWDLGQFFPSW